MKENMIARNLVRTYRNEENVLYALNHVEVEITPGEFAVILGPSGSGKTTLMNALSGLEQPEEGSILYDGADLTKMNRHQLASFRKKYVGYVFQSYFLIPTLNVEANVRMGADLAGNKDYMEIIRAVGLEGVIYHLPHQLSGGQQQRVSIARALAKKPEILFCDEPTGALDEETGRQVLEYLIQLQKREHFTVIMVTHNANIAELATKIIHMNSGKIVKIEKNHAPKQVCEIAW